MNHIKIKILVLMVLMAAGISCKKQWDSQSAGTDQQLNQNLMQAISAQSNLSTFAGYLSKLGYDKLLSSSLTYTVWAPDNQALSAIDQSIVADTAKLRAFVNNHIAKQSFFTADAKTGIRVRTLGGKRITFTSTGVEDATITTPNRYVANGVLHIINKALPPKMNIYEFIKNLTGTGQLVRTYILGQDTSYTDTTKATVSGIDKTTGKPILVAGTGLVSMNKYAARVANIQSEDSLYTFFVLTDNAYNNERNKISKYFKTVSGSVDTTMNMLAALNVLKDVAVKGVVLPANLPASLKSVNGVPVPIDKSTILQTYQASNGIVYVIDKMDFAVSDKITPIIIQGEAPTFFARTDRRSNYAYRVKNDPNGITYHDLMVSGSGLPAAYYAGYRLSNLYTCQYKVIWRAINDFYTTNTNISQRLGFSMIRNTVGRDGFLPLVQFPYTNVTPLNYNEVTLTGATNPNPTAGGTISVVSGTLSVDKYSSVDMFLQGANSTTVNANIFTADYIKLIPILN